MKYITVAALLPLTWAAIDARQATTDLQFEISDFSAACTTQSNNCFYDFTIATSNNVKFQESCEVTGTSDKGDLPAISKASCGTYTISVATSNDGGLVLTVNSDAGQGTYTISSDDLTTTTSGGSTVQSYTGDSGFTISIKDASSASSSASGATTSTPTASPTSSTSKPSTTGTATSSSASPSKTNSATRESAFNGVLFVVSLMAFMF